MTEVAARPWFLAAGAQLAVAALAGVLVAAGVLASPADLLLGLVFVFLVAGGLVYGYAPPFLKREHVGAWPATAALGLALAAAPLALAGARFAAYAAGAAFLVVPLHVAASALAGPKWRDGIALFAKDQPYRRGDRVAAALFAWSLVALALAGALLVWQPRGLLTAGLVMAFLGFALPFLGGALAFFLPRNAKTPLEGATLAIAALVASVLSTLALAAGFVFPAMADFRYPAFVALLADVLMLVALARARFPKPGAQIRRALPLLRGGAALVVLAGLGLALAMAGGLPGPLFAPAAYAHLVLACTLALAAALLGAPVLMNAVPRHGAWARVAAATGIAGVIVTAYAPFVGSLVLALAAAVALWGVAPMRVRRRDCPPDA